MPAARVILDGNDVNAYLVEHGLVDAYAPISAALMQGHGMSSGQPALMLVIEVDGKKVLAKTSLQIMETICSSMRAASGVPRAP